MKRIVSFFVVCVMILSLGACTTTQGESDEEKEVRSLVETIAMFEHNGVSIGGKEIKFSYALISTVEKISDDEYVVVGRMQMNDIYGTTWGNNFACTVVKSYDGENWQMKGDFQYQSSSWSRD